MGARRRGGGGRLGRRAALPSLECLEGRTLLANGLIKDINTADAFPSDLTVISGAIWYAARDVATGATALYRGGFVVKDISLAGSGVAGPSELTAIGARAFFVADDGVHGSELWTSDGTAAGTSLVRDLNPSGGSSPSNLVNLGGTLMFTASDGTAGVLGLWKSDGTAAGTTLVKSFSTVYGAPSSLTVVGNRLFFTEESSTGSDLYVSDGTASGTVLVKEFSRGGALTFAPGIADLTSLGTRLLFSGNDGGNAPALWRSDGTVSGTWMVSSVAPDPPPVGLAGNVPFVVQGGYAYFTSTTSIGTPAAPVYRVSLWRSNGIPDGTASVTALAYETSLSSYVAGNFQATPGRIFFTLGPTVSAAPTTLWSSDGTAAGTLALRSILPAGDGSDGSTAVASFATLGNVLYFSNYDPGTGLELWRSDGTQGGTAFFYDLLPGGDSGTPQALTPDGGLLVFSGHGAAGVNQLWLSDGTVGGTFAAVSFAPGVTLGSLDPTANTNGSGGSTATTINGRVIFEADDGIHGLEMWATNGTASGTILLADIAPGPSSSLTGLTASGQSVLFHGLLYFIADGGYGPTLWRTDGTVGGTAPAVYLGGLAISDLLAFNGALYFARTRPDASGKIAVDLIRSDGTAAGTSLLRSFRASNSGSGPALALTPFAGRLYFAADDGLGVSDPYGDELWSTDGTAAGTLLYRDINPGPGGSFPSQFQLASGVLFFGADDGVHGRELWAALGTGSVAVLIADINATSGGSAGTTAGSGPDDITAVGGRVFFTADDGVHGRGLWVSDGLPSHTVMVQAPPSAGGAPAFADLTSLGGRLLYEQRDSSGVWRPWVSDGTAAGTILLSGTAVVAPSGPIVISGSLAYFAARDPAHGNELWRSDGTIGGTTLIADLNPGAPSSNPAPVATLGGTLIVAAVDGLHGSEPFRVDLSVSRTEAVLGDYDGDHQSDISVYDPVTGAFSIRFSSGIPAVTIPWGYASNLTVPLAADFDGDGRTDVAVYDRTLGAYIIGYSSGKAPAYIPWGVPADQPIPVTADFDGDGKTDMATYDPVSGTFNIGFSAGFPAVALNWGDPGHHDIPLIGDYDGDRRADVAVFDPVTSSFVIGFSSGYPAVNLAYGDPSHHDIPITGDFDGDRRTDIGVYDPVAGAFIITFSSNYATVTIPWGYASDSPIPVIGDFDADRKTDICVYDPVTGTFYIGFSSGHYPAVAIPWGSTANAPIPGARAAALLASASPSAVTASSAGIEAQVLVDSRKRRADGSIVVDGLAS